MAAHKVAGGEAYSLNPRTKSPPEHLPPTVAHKPQRCGTPLGCRWALGLHFRGFRCAPPPATLCCPVGAIILGESLSPRLKSGTRAGRAVIDIASLRDGWLFKIGRLFLPLFGKHSPFVLCELCVAFVPVYGISPALLPLILSNHKTSVYSFRRNTAGKIETFVRCLK